MLIDKETQNITFANKSLMLNLDLSDAEFSDKNESQMRDKLKEFKSSDLSS